MSALPSARPVLGCFAQTKTFEKDRERFRCAHERKERVETNRIGDEIDTVMHLFHLTLTNSGTDFLPLEERSVSSSLTSVFRRTVDRRRTTSSSQRLRVFSQS